MFTEKEQNVKDAFMELRGRYCTLMRDQPEYTEDVGKRFAKLLFDAEMLIDMEVYGRAAGVCPADYYDPKPS